MAELCKDELPMPAMMQHAQNHDFAYALDQQMWRPMHQYRLVMEELCNRLERLGEKSIPVTPFLTLRERVFSHELVHVLQDSISMVLRRMSDELDWDEKFKGMQRHLFEAFAEAIVNNSMVGIAMSFDFADMIPALFQRDVGREISQEELVQILRGSKLRKLVRGIAAGNAHVMVKFLNAASLHLIDAEQALENFGILEVDGEYILTFRSLAICEEIREKVFEEITPADPDDFPGARATRTKYGCPLRFVKTAGGANGISFVHDWAMEAYCKYVVPKLGLKMEGLPANTDSYVEDDEQVG